MSCLYGCPEGPSLEQVSLKVSLCRECTYLQLYTESIIHWLNSVVYSFEFWNFLRKGSGVESAAVAMWIPAIQDITRNSRQLSWKLAYSKNMDHLMNPKDWVAIQKQPVQPMPCNAWLKHNIRKQAGAVSTFWLHAVDAADGCSVENFWRILLTPSSTACCIQLLHPQTS